MTTFTIDSADHIEHTTGNRKPDAGDHFSSLDELGHLAKLWPAPRLVRLWNSLPGVTPVKRFTDRKTALNRIWQALQNRGGNSAAKTKTRPKTRPRPNKPPARPATKTPHSIP